MWATSLLIGQKAALYHSTHVSHWENGIVLQISLVLIPSWVRDLHLKLNLLTSGKWNVCIFYLSLLMLSQVNARMICNSIKMKQYEVSEYIFYLYVILPCRNWWGQCDTFTCCHCWYWNQFHIHVLMQERHNSCALLMELHLSCTNQLLYILITVAITMNCNSM